MQVKVLVGLGISLLFMAIAGLFWQQELRYLQPTPVPANYVPVAVAQALELPEQIKSEAGRPLLLHFYNPDCPCSRFNTAHFISLAKTYGDRVDMKVILTGNEQAEAVTEMLQSHGLQLPVIPDPDHTLAESCGVYATPQAVLVDARGTLYYRGNYNRSRYCTDRATNFVQKALESLSRGEAPPLFTSLATTAWGCELSTETSSLFYFLSL